METCHQGLGLLGVIGRVRRFHSPIRESGSTTNQRSPIQTMAIDPYVKKNLDVGLGVLSVKMTTGEHSPRVTSQNSTPPRVYLRGSQSGIQ